MRRLVSVNRDGVFSSPVTLFIRSARGVSVSNFDSMVEKTTGVDIGFITAFNPNGEGTLRLNKDDFRNSKEAKLDQTSEWYALTDKLWREINSQDVDVVSLIGFYATRDSSSKVTQSRDVEKTFMIINTNGRLKSEVFISWVLELGARMNQNSVLVKPSKDLSVDGCVLNAEVAYYANCKTGKFSKAGRLSKLVTENWVALNADIEETGGSGFPAPGENFAFSYYLRSLDFSKALYGSTSYSNAMFYKVNAQAIHQAFNEGKSLLVSGAFSSFVHYDDLVSEFAQYCINENIIPPSYADVMKWYNLKSISPDPSNKHSIYQFIQDTLDKIINP